jgi:hypothetical protein
MAPCAFELVGISGNSFANSGANSLDNILIAPPFSPILMIPSHRAIIPVSPKESLKPSSALSKIEFTISENISGFPERVLKIATIKATIKKPTQI